MIFKKWALHLVSDLLFSNCECPQSQAAALEGARNLPENLSGERHVCRSVYSWAKHMCSSNPSEGHTVIFNLLHCRIPVKANQGFTKGVKTLMLSWQRQADRACSHPARLLLPWWESFKQWSILGGCWAQRAGLSVASLLARTKDYANLVK